MSWESIASGIIGTFLKSVLKTAFREVYAMLDFLLTFAISFLLGYFLLNGVPIKNLLLFSALIAVMSSVFMAIAVWVKNREISEIRQKLTSDLEKCKEKSMQMENYLKDELKRTQEACAKDIWNIYIGALKHIVRDYCRSEHIGRERTQKFGTVDVYLVDTQLGSLTFIVPTEPSTNVDVYSFIKTFWDVVSITKGKTKEEILNIVRNL